MDGSGQGEWGDGGNDADGDVVEGKSGVVEACWLRRMACRTLAQMLVAVAMPTSAET